MTQEDTKSLHDRDEADELWSNIGSFGKWQKLVLLMTVFISFFNSVPEFQYIYIAAEPIHWCKIKELQNVTWTTEEIKTISIPTYSRKGVETFHQCRQYDRNYSYLASLDYNETVQHIANQTDEKTKDCDRWEYDTSVYHSTLVSEWDLVCDDKVYVATIQSAFMFGVLVSSLVCGLLSDKFGRRPVLICCSILWIATAIPQCFPPSYFVYIGLRFLLGIFVYGAYLVGFVLVSEIVGTSHHRSLVGLLYQVPYHIGFMVIPGLAYAIRDWRPLQRALTIPSIIIIVSIWFIPESPRWLILNGKYKEGRKVLQHAAKTNNTDITDEDIQRIVEDASKNTEDSKLEEKKEATMFSKLQKLVSTREMFRRTTVSFFIWFVVNIMFYGLSLQAVHLPVDPFLATFIIAAVDLPALLLTIPLIDHFGRRNMTCATFIVGGISCFMVFVPSEDMGWLVTTFASIGKLCATSTFSLLYVYQAELYPTEIRNLGVGGASVMGRVGSIIAPYIVDLMRENHESIPIAIFGICGIVAGIISFLLPETNRQEIPETVEELERSLKKPTVAVINLN